MYVAGGIVYFNQLEQVCNGTRLECHDLSMTTPEDLASLQGEGITLRGWAVANVAYRTLITAIYCSIGFLIFARRRNEWVGLLFSYFLIAFGSIGVNYGMLAASYPAFTLPINIISFLAYVSFALFFATFPDGRMTPKAMWIPVGLWSTIFFLDQFFGWPGRGTPLSYFLAPIAWVGILLCGTLAQVYRYVRVSRAAERRQIKWVVFGITSMVVLIVGLYFSPLANQIGGAAVYSRTSLFLLVATNFLLTIIPLSIGIAILHYRLFDIDVIIRRTLIYGVLTVLLASLFFGGVTILQALLGQSIGNSQLATVVTTLAIAALALPLRNRIQAVIDRRFYRKKYDAQKTLEAFAARLQSQGETDVNGLGAEVSGVIQQTLQPTSVKVWLVETGAKR
jgi:hypothetical protein